MLDFLPHHTPPLLPIQSLQLHPEKNAAIKHTREGVQAKQQTQPKPRPSVASLPEEGLPISPVLPRPCPACLPACQKKHTIRPAALAPPKLRNKKTKRVKTSPLFDPGFARY